MAPPVAFIATAEPPNTPALFGAKATLAALDQTDRTPGGINPPELPAQGDGGQLGHRCSELHASGTCAYQDERHLALAFILIIGHIRQFIGT
jgi:hypothetical protein